ncbi:NifU family protein [Algivirga pacifica]|uniref:Scaffold protein Nfu/NifU N-terminal domain-containing protein n=1 Tax=Algivirga pacifica TaxID=1162670 RepID=A0ABP9D5W1_9BACT
MSDIKYNKEKLYPKNVTIYTEANPNPNSMKFMLSFLLIGNGDSFDFPDLPSAGKSPLATALFEKFDYIERVFLMANFITITKKESVEWMDVVPELKGFLKEFFETGGELFNEQQPEQQVIIDTDSEAVKKIKGVLDEYIKPAVESDGGAIQFHSFDEESGVVKVLLQGACSGCPSSTITLKAGIENMLKRMVPSVKEVVAEGV